jgi:hypothetical protein
MSGLGAYYQAKSLGMNDGLATSAMLQAQNREREARDQDAKTQGLLEEQNRLMRQQRDSEASARAEESRRIAQEEQRRLAQQRAREVEHESRRRAEDLRQKKEKLAHLQALQAEIQEDNRQIKFNKLTGQIESLLKELQAKHA